MEFYVVCTEKCIRKLESNNVSYLWYLIPFSFVFCLPFLLLISGIRYQY